MKKKLITCCGLLLLSPAAFSQTTTTNSSVQSNGVVVHESIGVEEAVVKSNDQVKTRTIDEWNLAECIDAMQFVNLKLAEASEDEKQKYESAKLILQKRIDYLKTTN